MKLEILDYEVNKRRLYLSCVVEDKTYTFEYDGWGNDHIVKGGKVITAYKHCVQAYITTHHEGCIFIDRQYKHNQSFDVYFDGKHYQVGEEN